LINWLSGGLRWVFDQIVAYSGNYGIAIILVTILIRLALLPLTIKQTKSLQAMKEIQPKLAEIQRKYKNNPQEMQTHSMKLYQEYKINPLGGCLPMLIQIPILWAFLLVLRTLPEDSAAQFLFWNLLQKDPYYVLPVLAMITQYINTQQTATDESQKGMLLVMPLFIGLVGMSLPAGLVLYWVINNCFSIVQQAWIAKRYPAVPQGGQTK